MTELIWELRSDKGSNYVHKGPDASSYVRCVFEVLALSPAPRAGAGKSV
jgi:hypothetical protein